MSEFSPITPYAAAKVTNILLAQTSSDRRVTPQMLYTYAKKNTIATVPGSKPIQFDGDAFKVWLDKYLAGGGERTRQDFDQLAAEYQ